MFSAEQASARVRWWALRPQGFSCKIRHRRRCSNIPADAPSRAPVQLADLPDCSLPETLFPLTAPDPDPCISFEAYATTLLVNDISLLNDAEKLASEQAKDHLLATLKIMVQSRDLPEDAPNSRLLQNLTKTTEVDALDYLHSLEEKKGCRDFQNTSVDWHCRWPTTVLLAPTPDSSRL